MFTILFDLLDLLDLENNFFNAIKMTRYYAKAKVSYSLMPPKLS